MAKKKDELSPWVRRVVDGMRALADALERGGMAEVRKKFRVTAVRPTRVGQVVWTQYGGRILRGRVVEDRGPIGFGGRRLYGVRLDCGTYVELPRDEFTLNKGSA